MNHFVYALVEDQAVRYVGYTSRLEQRRAVHRTRHPHWTMKIMESLPNRKMGLERERYWISNLFETGEPLVNIAVGGNAGIPGLEKSYLTKARISASLKGHSMSPETRAKISVAKKGRPHSAETRAKISATTKGRPGKPLSLETRLKIGMAQKGKPQSPELIAKRSAGLMGRYVSPETRAKISAAQKGKYIPPETCAKMSAAKKGKPWSVARRVAYERNRAQRETGQ